MNPRKPTSTPVERRAPSISSISMIESVNDSEAIKKLNSRTQSFRKEFEVIGGLMSRADRGSKAVDKADTSSFGIDLDKSTGQLNSAEAKSMKQPSSFR